MSLVRGDVGVVEHCRAQRPVAKSLDRLPFQPGAVRVDDEIGDAVVLLAIRGGASSDDVEIAHLEAGCEHFLAVEHIVVSVRDG